MDRRFLLEMLPGHAVCAEIGVWQGRFAQEILQVTEPQRLHLIDPWKHQEGEQYEEAWFGGKFGFNQANVDAIYEGVRARFENEIRAGQVQIHRGESGEVLEEFPDEYFDWVYIDGNHLYEFVMTDLELSFRKTKDGGYITGDNYDAGGWWEGGVMLAVDEFAKRSDVELVTVRDRQFVLRSARSPGEP